MLLVKGVINSILQRECVVGYGLVEATSKYNSNPSNGMIYINYFIVLILTLNPPDVLEYLIVTNFIYYSHILNLALNILTTNNTLVFEF